MSKRIRSAFAVTGEVMFKYNGNLKSNSQTLRKNMTKEERHLWYDFLKPLPLIVKRQKIIGNYIVDFYCESESGRFVIELDGSQHYEDEHQLRDITRDEYMNSLGLVVLRYSNRDINENFKNVCEDIYKNLFKPSLGKVPR